MKLSLALPSTKLLLNTTRLTARMPEGTVTGTGFFVTVPLLDPIRRSFLLVTAKHVVQGANEISCVLRPVSGDAMILDTDLRPFEESLGDHKQWCMHATEDVAVLLFDSALQRIKNVRGQVHVSPFSLKDFPTAEELSAFSAMQTVVIPGYPNGLWDETHGLPLLRRGVTASHPAVDFDGSPLGVVDAAVFVGSSGSPVCVMDEFMHPVDGGISMNHRVRLLGILTAGPDWKGEVELELGKGTHLVTHIPMHLGYYAKTAVLQSMFAQVASSEMM